MRVWHLGVFLSAFVAAMVSLLPMASVLAWSGAGEKGLAAKTVTGTAWRGSLGGIEWGGQSLGDARVAFSPLALVLGRIEFSMDGRDLQGRVRLGSAPQLQVANARVQVEQAIGEVQTELQVSQVDLRFAGGECRDARGEVRIELVMAGQPTQALAGSLRCDGTEAAVDLAPVAGPFAVQGSLRLRADGSFSAQWLANPDDPAMQGVLISQGFEPGPTGLGRVQIGRWLP